MPSPARTRLGPGRPKNSTSFDATVASAFGGELRDVRLSLNVSQEALADRADLGRSYLSRLERGVNQPSLFALMKLAAALGMDASELVARVERALSRSARTRGR